MKIFSKTPDYNFLGQRKIALIISAIVLLVGLGSIFTKGFTYGIDFRGGTQVQVKFTDKPVLSDLRKIMKDHFSYTPNITTFGQEENNEILISLSQQALESKEGLSLEESVTRILTGKTGPFEIRRIETVGPKVGEQLKTKAWEAVLFSLIGILAYIWFRFQLRYGLGAVAALFHDVIITLGIFSLMGKEINLTIVAALLTIVGYSLNDTIVVFDRVRENIARLPKKNLKEVINISINESLSRTILTSLTTFVVVATLWSLGGEIIHDFSFAMLIGIMVGTYSSIFVASPTILALEKRKKKA